jgi:hypothetical protein
MRTLCAVLDLNDIKYNGTDINIFDGEEYLDWSDPGFNPSGYQTPTLAENGKTIIGDAPCIYKYICMTKRFQSDKQIEENFYPRKKMNADRKKIIDKHLDYIENMVRRNSSRITKVVVQGLISKDKAINKDA